MEVPEGALANQLVGMLSARTDMGILAQNVLLAFVNTMAASALQTQVVLATSMLHITLKTAAEAAEGEANDLAQCQREARLTFYNVDRTRRGGRRLRQ